MRLALGAIWPTLVGACWGGLFAALPFIVFREHLGLPPVVAEWVILTAAMAVGGALGLADWKARLGEPPPAATHGAAGFADERRARRALGGPGGLIMRCATGGWLMRYDGPGHLLASAPTRSARASASSCRTCSTPTAPSCASTPRARTPA